MLLDRRSQAVVAVGCDQAQLVAGLGHALAVLAVVLLVHDRLDPGPALEQERELRFVRPAQEATDRRFARLQHQCDPGARAVRVEAVAPPGLEVEQELQLGGRCQRDQGQRVGRADLAYREVELGFGQRAHEAHWTRRVQQQLEALVGREAQRHLGLLTDAERGDTIAQFRGSVPRQFGKLRHQCGEILSAFAAHGILGRGLATRA